jgi:hypothetical protein
MGRGRGDDGGRGLVRDGINADVRIAVDRCVRVGQSRDRGVESGRSARNRGHGSVRRATQARDGAGRVLAGSACVTACPSSRSFSASKLAACLGLW